MMASPRSELVNGRGITLRGNSLTIAKKMRREPEGGQERITEKKEGTEQKKQELADKKQRWRDLFESIDRNGDGKLSRIEFIKTINESPALARELHELLGMPDHIRQEDGTRDIFVKAFDELDDDDSGTIDMNEFMCYLRRTEAQNAVTSKAAASAEGVVATRATMNGESATLPLPPPQQQQQLLLKQKSARTRYPSPLEPPDKGDIDVSSLILGAVGSPKSTPRSSAVEIPSETRQCGCESSQTKATSSGPAVTRTRQNPLVQMQRLRSNAKKQIGLDERDSWINGMVSDGMAASRHHPSNYERAGYVTSYSKASGEEKSALVNRQLSWNVDPRKAANRSSLSSREADMRDLISQFGHLAPRDGRNPKESGYGLTARKGNGSPQAPGAPKLQESSSNWSVPAKTKRQQYPPTTNSIDAADAPKAPDVSKVMHDCLAAVRQAGVTADQLQRILDRFEGQSDILNKSAVLSAIQHHVLELRAAKQTLDPPSQVRARTTGTARNVPRQQAKVKTSSHSNDKVKTDEKRNSPYGSIHQKLSLSEINRVSDSIEFSYDEDWRKVWVTKSVKDTWAEENRKSLKQRLEQASFSPSENNTLEEVRSPPSPAHRDNRDAVATLLIQTPKLVENATPPRVTFQDQPSNGKTITPRSAGAGANGRPNVVGNGTKKKHSRSSAFTKRLRKLNGTSAIAVAEKRLGCCWK